MSKALEVRCPTCKAAPGKPCTMSVWHRRSPTVHRARELQARALEQALTKRRSWERGS